MAKILNYLGLLIIVSNLFLLISCNSDDDNTPMLDRIEISSSLGKKLDLNEVSQLTATGFDQFDKPFTITSTLVWSANNDHVDIDQEGHVTALTVGTSTIKAEAQEVTATFTITVWDSSAPRTEIYVSDAGNFSNPPWQILKFDESGKNPEIFINSNLAWPQDIVFLEEQEEVLVSSLNSGKIARYNSNTGAFINNFASGISGPARMKVGEDGLLYVLQWGGNGFVYRYQLDGTFVDQFTSEGVYESIGLDWDVEGNLYVSSFNDGSGGSVRKFDSSGNDLGLFISTNLQGPTNIWFDTSGNLFVNDWQAGIVRKFDKNGSFLENFITGLNLPEGIDFMSNGNLLIGNGGTGSVKMYSSSGDFIKDIITSGAGDLITPNAVVVRHVNGD